MAEEPKASAQPQAAPPGGAQPPQIRMSQPQQPPAKPTKEELSTAIGAKFGGSIKSAKFDVDVDLIAKAIKDTLAGKEVMDDRKANDAINGAIYAAQQESKEKGEKFLAENAKKPGVKTTASGLQYEVLKEGTGATPKGSDLVTAHYRGTLIDGTEFDSSYTRNQPLTRPADRLIKGWTEALYMMKVGSKYKLYIPAALAYGDRGMPPKIGPGETLIFEMELLDVKPAEPPPAPPAPAASTPGKTNETVVSGEIIKVPSAEEMKKGAKIEVIKQSEITNYLKTNEVKEPKK